MINTQGLSTKTIDKWPDIKELKALCVSLSVLSLIQEDSERYTYEMIDDESDFFQMNNGEGDFANIIFDVKGAIFKGFYHECIFAYWYGEGCPWPKKDGKWLPTALQAYWEDFIDEESVSFVAWSLNKSKAWNYLKWDDFERAKSAEKENIKDANGSEYIWDYLPLKPELYVEWEGRYYEKKLDLETIKKIYQHKPLTRTMVKKLNPNFDFTNSEITKKLKLAPYKILF